jgi:hypothetical protein
MTSSRERLVQILPMSAGEVMVSPQEVHHLPLDLLVPHVGGLAGGPACEFEGLPQLPALLVHQFVGPARNPELGIIAELVEIDSSGEDDVLAPRADETVQPHEGLAPHMTDVSVVIAHLLRDCRDAVRKGVDLHLVFGGVPSRSRQLLGDAVLYRFQVECRTGLHTHTRCARPGIPRRRECGNPTGRGNTRRERLEVIPLQLTGEKELRSSGG